MGKVRILNTKTGDIKYVSELIGNNERLLKSYGFIKQDLGEKPFGMAPKTGEALEEIFKDEKKAQDLEKMNEEVIATLVEETINGLVAEFGQVGDLLAAETISVPVTVNEHEAAPILIELTPEQVQDIKARYTELTGKKPGIKKPETLLKEIKELETKQD